jgi:methylated-DNA-[protein]-cysteine S-methyltransferase
MNFFHDTFRTSFGRFSLAVDESGAVVATAFGSTAALSRRLPACRRMPGSRPHFPSCRSTGGPRHLVPDQARCAPAREQMLAYLAGQRRAFALPLAPPGTPFQQRVWAMLQEIPPGQTRTYGQLAAQLGCPRAARAVGRALATNPLCVIVPCHRVLGARGALTGFAFGQNLKRRLLAFERSVFPAQSGKTTV